ncbi:MAG TPA: hypothetical protein VHA79_09215 [Mycobacteriales bacterium]|nr:hypothetical protein [Mycobacteriales bacterium]
MILATGVGRVIAYLERRVREDLRVVDDAGLPDGELPISAWVADAFRAAGIRSGQTPATARLLREYERMLRRPVRKDFRDVGSPSLSALGRVLRELEATDRPLSSLQDRLGRREETASAWIKRFENALYRRLDE